MVSIKYDLIIAAAGSSERFGSNKLMALIGGKTVLERAVAPFVEDHNCEKILVMAGKLQPFFSEQFASVKKIKVLTGGTTRQATVEQGLQHVTNKHVLIHDGARPYVKSGLIERVCLGLMTTDAVIPVVFQADSLLQIKDDGLYYLNRDTLRAIQTPQGFDSARLKQAFNSMASKVGREEISKYGDEGSIFLAAYGSARLTLVEGDRTNLKITYPEDLHNYL